MANEGISNLIRSTFRGSWASDYPYQIRDTCESGGSVYYCLIANLNSVPPNTNWSLMISKGDAGGVADMATKTYKGRTSAGTGAPEDVAVATLKTDLALAKADVGLGSADNTADTAKPVSTAQQTALDLKADKVTGKSLVADTEIAKIHSSNADTDLDATFEAAIKNTDNHTDGTTNKVYTATEKTKLAGIATGAQVNNISDVNATDLTDGGATTLHSHSGGAGETLITGVSGTVASAAAPTRTLQVLTADNDAHSVLATPVTQMTALTMGVGWWLVEYWVLWQSAAATTGITFVVSHSGTAANFQATRIDPLASTTALATVGIFDQQPTTAVTGKLPSTWATRTNGGSLGPSAGVVLANVNCLTYVTALLLVTVSGNLLLNSITEINGSAVRVMAGTNVRYTRLS